MKNLWPPWCGRSTIRGADGEDTREDGDAPAEHEAESFGREASAVEFNRVVATSKLKNAQLDGKQGVVKQYLEQSVDVELLKGPLR